VRIWAVLVLVGLLLAGCTVAHDASKTYTMEGNVYVNSDGLAGCDDVSSFADVKAGGGLVVVSDERGARVATTHLSGGTTDTDRQLDTSGCILTFTAQVPKRETYSFTFSGHRPLPPSSYSFASLVSSHWKPTFLIGILPPVTTSSAP
jgi:hypothetical protein